MPNIELHGYALEAAATVKERVRTALSPSPHADEIVTTIYTTEVEDLKGKKMPFLRVITSPDELPDLKERLASLNEDIEVIMLGEWIPKRT